MVHQGFSMAATVAWQWDENKRKTNLAKHGLDFVYVGVIFADVNAIEIIDNRKNYGEIRKRIIGKYSDKAIVVVVHTDRSGIARIISMRPANKKERSLYYGNS